MFYSILKIFANLLLCFFFCFSARGQFSRNYNRETNPFKNGYQRVAVGANHTFELRGGKLFAYGENFSGQLGLGDYENRNVPEQVGTAADWVLVAAGFDFTMAIKNDGSLWSWGNNNQAQLGYGTFTSPRPLPQKVDNASDWVGIAVGETHTIALKSNGTLWSLGNSLYGQLGLGHNERQLLPTQVGTDNDWIMVSAGLKHTMALKSNGTLWTWGYNGNGELGLGDLVDRNVPTQVGTDKTWLVVIGGGEHSLALKCNGTLWSWGNNNDGQLGLGDNMNRSTPTQVGIETNWRSLGSGWHHSLAIKNQGTLFTWGRNDSGELGLSDYSTRNQPTQVGTGNSWVSLAPGIGMHSVSYTVNGMLNIWGNGLSGQLGLGNFTSLASPFAERKDNRWMKVHSGSNHGFLMRSDGAIFGWGYNLSSVLGMGDQETRSTPDRMGTDNKWVDLSAGTSSTFGLKSDGTLWAWGSNNSGQLGTIPFAGNKSTPARVLGLSNVWKNVAAGGNHTAAVRVDGTLWTWGGNMNGQLGSGPIQISSDIRSVSSTVTNWLKASTGVGFTVALRNDGTLWAWGNNSSGQLGLGDNTNRSTPVQVGNGTSWTDCSVGERHTLAIKSDGTLWSWGDNYYGQLGIGYYNNVSGVFENKNIPVQVGTDSDWIRIDAGEDYSMALKSNGTLWVWGWNGVNQLGIGYSTFGQEVPFKVGTDNNWMGIAGGYTSSYAIKVERDKLCATGFDTNEQLGNGIGGAQTVFVCETGATILPLIWNSFTVRKSKSNAYALLEWSTTDEQNTKDFIIQQSGNGTKWINVGNVLASGNSNKLNQYSFTHTNPLSGKNFYRLLQRDLDYKQKYSEVRLLEFSPDEVSPNFIIGSVVNGWLFVQLKSMIPQTLQLFSSDGRVILRKTLAKGVNSIDLTSIPKGVYFLQTGGIFKRKLILN
jgi:alpha-tubulin suppressor-like RCC1 family protein